MLPSVNHIGSFFHGLCEVVVIAMHGNTGGVDIIPANSRKHYLYDSRIFFVFACFFEIFSFGKP